MTTDDKKQHAPSEITAKPDAPSLKSSVERYCRALTKRQAIDEQMADAEQQIRKAAQGTGKEPMLVTVDGMDFTVLIRNRKVKVTPISQRL